MPYLKVDLAPGELFAPRDGSVYPFLVRGQRIRFAGERATYSVKAVSSDRRYAIATRPYNPKRTYQYTIIDFLEGVRGPDNLVFGNWNGYGTQHGIDEAIAQLEAGDMEVTHRHWLYLRYANDQPDPRTARDLDLLRASAIRAFTERPLRRNYITRLTPRAPEEFGR